MVMALQDFELFGKDIWGKLIKNNLFIKYKIKYFFILFERSTLEPLSYCENSYSLICDFLRSDAKYGRIGINKHICLDKTSIKQLIKDGKLDPKDGDQF